MLHIGAQLRGDEPVHGRGNYSVAHRSQWRRTTETRDGRTLYERILIVKLYPGAHGWRFEEIDSDERPTEGSERGKKRAIERVPDNEDTITTETLDERDVLTSLAREVTTRADLADLRFEWIGRLVYAEETLENWYAANSARTDVELRLGDGAALVWQFRGGDVPPPAPAVGGGGGGGGQAPGESAAAIAARAREAIARADAALAHANADSATREAAIRAAAAREAAVPRSHRFSFVSQQNTIEEVSALIEIAPAGVVGQLVTGGSEGLITLWRQQGANGVYSAQYAPAIHSRAATYYINTLAADPGGGFVSGSNGGDVLGADGNNDTVRFWEKPDIGGLRSHILAIEKKDHHALCVLSTGMIVTCGLNSSSHVWSKPDATFATRLLFRDAGGSSINCYQELANGMLFCGTNEAVNLYSVSAEDGRLRLLKSRSQTFVVGDVDDEDATNAVSVSRDGKPLSGHFDYGLVVWKKPTVQGNFTRLDAIKVPSPIGSIAVETNTGMIVTGHKNGTLRAWQAPNARGETAVVAYHDFGVSKTPTVVALRNGTFAVGISTRLYVFTLVHTNVLGAEQGMEQCAQCGEQTTVLCPCCARAFCGKACQRAGHAR